MWAQVVNILIGLWAMISPAVFHAEQTAADNNHITGPLIITFAVTSLWEINRSVRLVNIVIGGWLALSPLFIHFGQPMWLSNVIAGIVVVILSLVKQEKKTHYGGGWRSLFQKNPVHMKKANVQNK